MIKRVDEFIFLTLGPNLTTKFQLIIFTAKYKIILTMIQHNNNNNEFNFKSIPPSRVRREQCGILPGFMPRRLFGNYPLGKQTSAHQVGAYR